ncbi:hypothetical protein RYG71_003854 [Salmonella enterica]|nr:hypothetical protein [Salmonella enterica]
MITDVENNSAKITALINAVAILFSQLPEEKKEHALFLLHGLSDYDYKKINQQNLESTIEDVTSIEQALTQGYKLIIESIDLYPPGN